MERKLCNVVLDFSGLAAPVHAFSLPQSRLLPPQTRCEYLTEEYTLAKPTPKLAPEVAANVGQRMRPPNSSLVVSSIRSCLYR